MVVCSYGCGNEAKYFFKNGKGCCSEFSSSCLKMREINKNKNSGEKNGMYGRHHSNITKQKIGEKSKEKIFTEEYRKKLSEAMSGNKRRIGFKHSEETKNKISKALKGIPLSQKNKLGISKALKGRKFTLEWRLKLSEAAKRRFKNPDFLRSFKKSIEQKPTGIEKKILNMIKNYGYEYTGDFSLWIDGKNPDFINEENKKVIEVFGNYWHNKMDEPSRSLHFKKNGYKILIIWEKEIKLDFENVKKRFLKFNFGK